MATAAEIRAELEQRKRAQQVTAESAPTEFGRQVHATAASPIKDEMSPSMQEIRAMTPDEAKDPVAVESAAEARARLENTPERRAARRREIQAELRRRKRVAEEQKTPEQKAKEEWEARVADYSDDGFVSRSLQGAVGVGEIGLMIATGAAAEVVSGWAGLLGGGTAAERAARVESLSDAMTFTPKTVPGDAMLRTIAKPLLWLDTQARDISEKSSDSPLVQAGIYTAITGGVELIGLKGAGKVKVDPKFDKALKDVQKTADDMGIKLTQTEMIDSIIDKAAELSPAVRAQHAPELRDALLQARNQSRLVVQQQVGALRQAEASMRAGDVTKFAQDLGTWMTTEGFDVAKMPGVKSALDDLGKIDKVSPLTGKRKAVEEAKVRAENATGHAEIAGGGMIELPGTMRREMAEGAADAADMARREVDEVAANHAVTLNEIQTIRNRMEKSRNRIKQEGAEKFSDEAVALRTVETKLDEFLDNTTGASMRTVLSSRSWTGRTLPRPSVLSSLDRRRSRRRPTR
jgi:hypothetical protein